MTSAKAWLPPEPIGLGQYFPDASPAQSPADVAVVMPTILRPIILKAVESVFAQEYSGRIQLLIGVDKASGPIDPLLKILARRPANISAVILALPYSTSIQHGGVHYAVDGGALRAILSLTANSRYVAYLDDDNIWRPNHLSGLHAAMPGKAWAFSQRMLVDQDSGAELGVDRWDSLGPHQGRFAADGGFVDPNCLMLDKISCAQFLARWSDTSTGRPSLRADRLVFAAIRDLPYGHVAMPTVLYAIRKTNILHQMIRGDIRF
ncbi:MAG: hypothetical protein RLZZ57_1862 [Pseudomonadota bacterium]|jgi:hypothetical protein|nr:glycosyltransferase family 2 protein [Acetobacteraceae bacterium]NBS42524.1 glycosyltransferase family 2 protein [Acetobacteraceae bacterium]